MKTNTTTAAKLLEVSRQLGLSLPEVMLRRERELNETPPEVVYEKLRVAYGIMQQAVEESLREPHKTMGGLIGGEARKLAEYQPQHILDGQPCCREALLRAAPHQINGGSRSHGAGGSHLGLAAARRPADAGIFRHHHTDGRSHQ